MNFFNSKNYMYCTFFGHKFEVSKHVTSHIKEYTCCHCKKEMTTNTYGALVELTEQFKEINLVLAQIHKKKRERKMKAKLFSNKTA